MQRKLSYRKPVPIYIPSPPASPPSSPATTQLVASFLPPHLLGQASPTTLVEGRQQRASEESVLPELPSNWREVITKALETGAPIQLQKQLLSEPQTPQPELEEAISYENAGCVPSSATSSEGKQEGRMLSRIPSTLSKSSGRRARWKAHQSYRPPTPPLPSCRDLPEPDTLILDSFGMPEERCKPSSVLPYAALQSNTSFGTERTMTSLTTSIPSATWSGTASNSSGGLHMDGGLMPIYHVAAPDKRGRRTRKLKRSPTKTAVVSLWDRVGTWGTSVKSKLKRFRRLVVGY
ncbi:hypothetical protein BDN72DRAFT_352509 [Pluteus cervinus]|uniref:Uncharacterized protein n=1 Tax=Pluteus cervinus TaxID=181527 RepID=A0ACD3BCS5_9AGAR|nr:hypothetical protein BDN72DRAFT_352509 [Pluteus cervinus]